MQQVSTPCFVAAFPTSQPHQAAVEIHLHAAGFRPPHGDMGSQSVELAAGIDGIGLGGHDTGFPQGDEVLQGGIQPAAHVAGCTAGRVRLAVRQQLQNAPPHGICQQGKDHVPLSLNGIGTIVGGSAALGHEMGFTRSATRMASPDLGDHHRLTRLARQK